jgi:glyoxylase-like metal-dependent hydrolase (beta-lactamase superfamily II)
MRLHPRVYLVGSGEIGLSDSWDCHVYVVDGGSELALIDAGGGRPQSCAMIRQNMLDDGLDVSRVRHVVLTHCHHDHAGGAAGWRAEVGAKVYLPEIERALFATRPFSCPVDVGVEHDDVIAVGDLSLRAIQVPGHSPGICAYLLEVDGYRALFAADIVFANGVIGLINFEGSEMAPYRHFLPRLADLHIDALLPGHLLFALRNGQAHIDLALAQMKRGFVPLSIGQLDAIYRSPDDY